MESSSATHSNHYEKKLELNLDPNAQTLKLHPIFPVTKSRITRYHFRYKIPRHNRSEHHCLFAKSENIYSSYLKTYRRKPDEEQTIRKHSTQHSQDDKNLREIKMHSVSS
jgi:hypothetical protein